MITALLIGAGALYLLRKKHNEAIGKVERVKRRIYKEVSLAQQEGVDFSKKFPELTTQERSALERVGKQVGWKQSKRSIESGKPYVESYYGSLRRAWNAVSGIAGIGATSYDVYDRDGNVCLTWTDVTDHIEHEPEAKVLLALPPHIEEKKKKAKRASKAKDAEEMQRANFASMFLRDYIDDEVIANGKGWAGVEIDEGVADFLKKTISQYNQPVKTYDIIYNAWVNKQYRINKNKGEVKFTFFLDGKEYTSPTDRPDGKIFLILDKYYKMYLDDAGWREHADELDEIRKDLLDKAKHMHVSLPEDVYREERDNLSEESGNGYVRGNDRYNYLPYINWIYFVHMKYANGEETYYPKFSFDTKEDAMKYQHGYYANIKDKPDHGAGWKIIPVWDVPIEKITGLN